MATPRRHQPARRCAERSSSRSVRLAGTSVAIVGAPSEMFERTGLTRSPEFGRVDTGVGARRARTFGGLFDGHGQLAERLAREYFMIGGRRPRVDARLGSAISATTTSKRCWSRSRASAVAAHGLTIDCGDERAAGERLSGRRHRCTRAACASPPETTISNDLGWTTLSVARRREAAGSIDDTGRAVGGEPGLGGDGHRRRWPVRCFLARLPIDLDDGDRDRCSTRSMPPADVAAEPGRSTGSPAIPRRSPTRTPAGGPIS